MGGRVGQCLNSKITSGIGALWPLQRLELLKNWPLSVADFLQLILAKDHFLAPNDYSPSLQNSLLMPFLTSPVFERSPQLLQEILFLLCGPRILPLDIWLSCTFNEVSLTPISGKPISFLMCFSLDLTSLMKLSFCRRTIFLLPRFSDFHVQFSLCYTYSIPLSIMQP